MTVTQFRVARALPRSTFYAEVKAGRITPVKRGTQTLIHIDEARRYDEALLSAGWTPTSAQVSPLFGHKVGRGRPRSASEKPAA